MKAATSFFILAAIAGMGGLLLAELGVSTPTPESTNSDREFLSNNPPPSVVAESQAEASESPAEEVTAPRDPRAILAGHGDGKEMLDPKDGKELLEPIAEGPSSPASSPFGPVQGVFRRAAVDLPQEQVATEED